MTTPTSPECIGIDPVALVSEHSRFALWNAVCLLSLRFDISDDELVPRAKVLLGLVDHDIRRTHRNDTGRMKEEGG